MKKKRPAQKRGRKWLRRLLVLFFVAFAGLILFFGAISYWVTNPGDFVEAVTPSTFLLTFEEFVWETEQGRLLEAWFIPGAKGSPGILLAPGFELGRSDVLSLAARLKERGYHSLVFRRSQKGALLDRGNAIGLHDEADILAALDLMLARPGVDTRQAGVWGVDVKARGALGAAARRSEIKAVVADSPFNTANEFLRLRLRRGIFPESAFIEHGCRWMLALVRGSSVENFFVEVPVERLEKCRVLFLQGENRAEMTRLAAPVYHRLRADKQMELLPLSRVRMMKAEEMEAYDRQVVRFFRSSLPVPEDPEEAAGRKARPGNQVSKPGGGKK